MTGSWATNVIDNSAADTGECTGIAIDSNNNVHISYLDYSNTALKYATNVSGSWKTFIIDHNGTVGWWTSVAIDSNDKVHISYMDYGNYQLKYATNASGPWETSVIDSASVGPYSLTTSIAIDMHDRVYIAYLASGALKYATNASGSWGNHIVDNPGTTEVGLCNSIAIDSAGKVHISYMDVGNSGLKYASASYVVNTVPLVLQISIDGLTYATPYILDPYWVPATIHTLGAISPQDVDAGTRYAFSFWSDGGAQTHSIIVPSSPTIYTANFDTQYSLTTSAYITNEGSDNVFVIRTPDNTLVKPIHRLTLLLPRYPLEIGQLA